MKCPRCGSTIYAPATTCGCGSAPAASSIPAPPVVAPPGAPARRMIPTGNKPALIGYYVAIASVLPWIWMLGFAAVALGGWGFAEARDAQQGKGHAITAIVVGLASIVIWGGERLGFWVVPIARGWQ